jgi:hypothetical protein
MTLDHFLDWFIGHNVVLIEVLLGAILIGVTFVLFRSVVAGKEDINGPSLKDIEKTLRQVLDSTEVKPSVEVENAAAMIKDSDAPAAPVAAASPEALAAAAAQAADLEKLKNEVALRDKTLSDLQKALEEAKKAPIPTGPVIDTKPLEDKIKELQARLGEYEIIEDDIANLSTYKQDNQKLKAELDALRAKLVSNVVETGTSSDNVKRFAALVGTEAPPATPPPREGAPPSMPAAAQSPAAKPAAAPASPPAPAAALIPEPTLAPTPSAPIVAAAAVAVAAPVAAAATGPVVVASEASTPSESVFGAVDTDKLLAETANLPEAAPEASGAEEDSGSKLISEFENFMKGG